MGLVGESGSNFAIFDKLSKVDPRNCLYRNYSLITHCQRNISIFENKALNHDKFPKVTFQQNLYFFAIFIDVNNPIPLRCLLHLNLEKFKDRPTHSIVSF